MGPENQFAGSNSSDKSDLKIAKTVHDLFKFAQQAEQLFRQQMTTDGAIFQRAIKRYETDLPPWPKGFPVPAWFRGQSLRGEGLIPKCRRKLYGYPAWQENHVLSVFMLGAHARTAEQLPAKDDYAGWLAVAQHHGLPTRLLDWSGSVLVAAFFATQDRSPEEDGIIYSVSPSLVNAEFGEHTGPSQLMLEYHDPNVQICDQRFSLLTKSERDKAVDYTKQCLKDRTLTQKEANRLWPVLKQAEMTELVAGAFGASVPQNTKTLAVGPRQTTRRIMQQLGFFTIHGGGSISLENAPYHNDFLLEITIPAAEKKNIRNQLRLLGITRSQLFPDLDNLATEIADDFTSNSNSP